MKNDLNQKSWWQLMRQFGTSYFWATLLLPRQIQYETVQFYKYVRIPDQIVDDPSRDLLSKEKALSDLYAQRCYVYEHDKLDDDQFWPWLQIMKSKYLSNIYIWKWYMDAFWEAMKNDLKTMRYDSYEQLQWYMYGSAEIVGLVMCDLIGYDEKHREETLAGARKLSEAMQLTNFLRDVAEDWNELGRIYMPSDDLSRFWLSHEDVIRSAEGGAVDVKWIDFMREMVARCDKLYDEANQTIKYLDSDSRDAVYIAWCLYRAILRKIESIWYNQFGHSARTGRRDKFLVIAKEQLVCKYIISCLR